MIDNTRPLQPPEWRSALTAIKQKLGIEYGTIITPEFMEQELHVKDGTVEFRVAMNKIADELERLGFYLTIFEEDEEDEDNDRYYFVIDELPAF